MLKHKREHTKEKTHKLVRNSIRDNFFGYRSQNNAFKSHCLGDRNLFKG